MLEVVFLDKLIDKMPCMCWLLCMLCAVVVSWCQSWCVWLVAVHWPRHTWLTCVSQSLTLGMCTPCT